MAGGRRSAGRYVAAVFGVLCVVLGWIAAIGGVLILVLLMVLDSIFPVPGNGDMGFLVLCWIFAVAGLFGLGFYLREVGRGGVADDAARLLGLEPEDEDRSSG